MKMALAVLILLFANSSFAAACGGNSVCGSPIDGAKADTVKALFDSGIAPTNLAQGDYAGRCFVADGVNPKDLSTYVPAAAYLDFNSAVQSEFGVFAVGKQRHAPLDFYDNGANLASVSAERESLSQQSTLPISEKNGSLLESFHSDVTILNDHLKPTSTSSANSNEAYELRQSNGVLTAKIEMTAPLSEIPDYDKDDGTVGIGEIFKAGDAVAYCYFFQQVR
jgi:hypothetical protein